MTRATAAPSPARVVHAYRQTGLSPGVHVGTPGAAIVWVIDLDDSFRLAAAGTGGVRRFTSSVSGLSLQRASIHHGTVQCGVYVELSPDVAGAVFGVPAAELADDTVALDQLWGPEAERLRDRLHAAPAAGREVLIHRVIRDRAARAPGSTDAALLWRLATERGLTPGQLARESGWSARHLRRLVLAQTGLPPGAVTRLARFERSLSDVRHHGVSLGVAAARHGYADQAHLTREWRALLGMTPTEFLSPHEHRRQGVAD